MGLTKKILFDNDPARDGIRADWRTVDAEHVANFTVPIQTKRKNRIGRGPYWDAFWPSALAKALEELGIESIIVNDRYCVRTAEQARTVRERAEAIHEAKISDWQRLREAKAAR